MYYVCVYWCYRLFWRCSNTSQLKLVPCFIVTRLHQVKVNRTTVLCKSYANFCSTKGSNTLPFTKHNSINLPKHKSIHPNKNQFTKTQLNFSKQKQFSQIWFIFPETNQFCTAQTQIKWLGASTMNIRESLNFPQLMCWFLGVFVTGCGVW